MRQRAAPAAGRPPCYKFPMSSDRPDGSPPAIVASPLTAAPESRSGSAAIDPRSDESLPAPVRDFLRGGGKLERIRLDEEGRFWHEGEPILNERLRALFHRSVARSPGGTWLLHVPPFVYPIEVADTPYHVRSLRLDPGERQVWLRLSDESEEALDLTTLSYDERRGLAVAVKGGGHRARLTRAAFHALCDRLEETPAGALALRLPWGQVAPVTRE